MISRMDSPIWREARELDERDPLQRFRAEFHLPPGPDGQPACYLVGNSLGLQPRRTLEFVQQELTKWQCLAVRGHFEGEFPWMPYHEFLTQPMASLLGAEGDEVVMMNSLTVNLHLMLATFYRPTRDRYKILIEEHAFPSDHFAVESQLRWHGQPQDEAMILVRPRPGEYLLRTEDICDCIERNRESLAVIVLPGVQYYTGQWLDLVPVVERAHAFGIVVGVDLAHAAGNVPLDLHASDIDFAVWCSYKYLNSGPGSVGGCFVHRRHARRTDLPRFAGWWGQEKASRFRMENKSALLPTAEGWQLSNPPILSLAAIRAAQDVFQEAGGMPPLREKSLALTAFLERLLQERMSRSVRIITPRNPQARGCQLSLVLENGGSSGRSIQEALEAQGVITDWREPNVIRAAPVPLYNTFGDCVRFVETLEAVLD